MSDENAIVEAPKKAQNNITALERLAQHAYQSGLFKGKVNNISSGVIALAFGQDLGLSATTSLTSIHVIDGKPSMSANLMLALVKKTPGWKVKVVKRTHTECVLEWSENGEVLGRSEFTMEDAKLAGLANKDNWRKYPKQMLFNRCVADGFRTFCPHLACGHTVYTPDELGAQVDDEGEVIETTFTITKAQVEEIEQMFQESGTDIPEYLAKQNLTSISDMTPEQYDMVKKRLTMKIAASKVKRN